MREKCIQATGLTKSFGGRKVMEGLSFQVYRGEAFALLGHNGAGKSTTIDLILGLKAPDEGSASILGMEASENRRRVFEKVGVQLQNTGYQNLITVEEVCMEYASLYRDSANWEKLLESFGLSGLRKRGSISFREESGRDCLWCWH